MVRMETTGMDAADELGRLIVDDETLLGLISSQDESALWSLYERYSRLLYTIALRITGDSGTAEECTQDVFQSVWLRAAQFRPSAGSVQSWLSAIARHRAIDEVRSKWHRACQMEYSFEGLPDFQSAVGRGWEQLSLLRTDLQAALAALPLKQRQAIELAFYGGLTTNEIALSLGESVGTIKSRLRLGLDRLRGAANAWWEGT
jgi:RNA polymerase sigma-70 factor (ECF subfamily)